MKIDLSDGTFFCFGCGETGNAHRFVQLVNNNLDDLKTSILLAKILKSDKVSNVVFRKFKKQRKQNSQYYNEAYDYYHGLRTFDWKDESQFEEEAFECRDYMTKRGFTTDTLTRCKAKLTYNKSYPIIFPMFDNGRFRGWVCRTNNKTVEKKRKYLYNKGFSRATTLPGEYRDTKAVVVVEGFMDLLKMRQFGERKVVCLLGWKATAEQIAKLKEQGVTDIISALDNDVCGNKGTKYLEKFFNVTRWEYLQGLKDAGDMNKAQYMVMRSKTLKEYKKSKLKTGIAPKSTHK